MKNLKRDRFRTHIFVVCAESNTRIISYIFCNLCTIDNRADTPSIGGKMSQIDKTFPTIDCSACILTPKMVEASSHPNITMAPVGQNFEQIPHTSLPFSLLLNFRQFTRSITGLLGIACGNGHIVRPSDHKEPKTVVMVKCVGSRDPEHGKSYCSRTCCMYTAKQATMIRDHCPDTKVYVFYMDARANFSINFRYGRLSF